MIIRISQLMLVCAIALFCIPFTTFAAEDERTLEATILFTLTYRITTNDDAVAMPIAATRDAATQSSVGFEILRDEKATKTGTASGIIMSAAPITEDLTYSVPAHSDEEFTLLVIYNNKDFPRDTEHSVRIFKSFFDVSDASVKLLNSSAGMKYSYVEN